MNTPLWPRRLLAGWGALALLLLLGPAFAGAADITGTYADKGTRIPDHRHPSLQEVSLHALLRLDLEPESGRIRHLGTDRLQLVDTGDRLQVFIHDREGALEWSGEYSGAGYQREGGATVLRLRAAADRDDAVVLVLTIVEHGLLHVTAYRVFPGVFGRSAEVAGQYLFHRVP